MRILLGTDGSEYSDRAVEKCCTVFGASPENSFLVVSAYEDAPVMAAEPFALSAEYYQKLTDAARSQAEHYAENAATSLSKKCVGNVETRVLHGTPEKCIVDEASDWKADVIVVGSHGRGFWGRLLGSVSDGVVHHASCSVLVVRGE